ncbi:MAG: hypothetical protein AABY50_09585 [Nitrospirota bacterium]
MLTAVDVYKKIAPKLGDEEATAIITFIEDSIQRGTATKADLQETEAALHETTRLLETNLRNEIKGIETNLRNEIKGIETSLRNEIVELRGLLIKYILPLSALIGGVVGTIISIFIR